jgi:hypothetical protein
VVLRNKNQQINRCPLLNYTSVTTPNFYANVQDMSNAMSTEFVVRAVV